jgi:hypothetical protein
MPKTAEDKRKEHVKCFAKAQAALPEDQRLENWTDLATPSKRAFVFSTMYSHKVAHRWCQEFMQEYQPKLYDQKYFDTQGCPLYKPENFKTYSVCLEQTKTSCTNDKLAISTIVATVRNLFVQVERKRRCQILKLDKEVVTNFIQSNLRNQEGLTTATLVKPFALAGYVTYALCPLLHSMPRNVYGYADCF